MNTHSLPPSYDVVTSNTPNGVATVSSNQTQREQPIVYIAPPIATQNAVHVNTHLGWSIFNILCCCPILSCIACFYSVRTDDAKSAGDLQNALKNSETARIFNIISTVLGVISTIVPVLVLAIYFSTQKRATEVVVQTAAPG